MVPSRPEWDDGNAEDFEVELDWLSDLVGRATTNDDRSAR